MLTSLIAFIVVIGVLVTIHEFGHYLAARSVGVQVEKFYIGFNLFGYGFKKVINGTEYGVGWLPLGGYVKLAGMLDESFDEKRTNDPGDFHLQPMWAKIWIMSAGVIMNFLLAVFIFSMMTFSRGELIGLSEKPIIGTILKHQIDINDKQITTPAYESKLGSGDVIVEINNHKINAWKDISDVLNEEENNSEYIIRFERNSVLDTITIKPRLMKIEFGKSAILSKSIGIVPEVIYEKRNLLESFSVGLDLTKNILVFMCKTIYGLITGEVSHKNLGGPLAIAQIAGDSAREGIYELFFLMAVLSVNLGLMNILPIPGLDGGHVFITLIEGLLGRELSMGVKMRIQQLGIFMILILFIIIMFNDISRLFS